MSRRRPVVSILLYTFSLFVFISTWLESIEANPTVRVYQLVHKRSSSSASSGSASAATGAQTIDDAVIARALSLQPRTHTELEQFRVLTNVLKLLVEKRAKQLQRISLISEDHAARVQNDLARLRRYSTSLNEVMQRFEAARDQLQQEQQRDANENVGVDSEQSISKTVVNGINQPLWLLQQLRKVEQQRRRSRSEAIGMVD